MRAPHMTTYLGQKARTGKPNLKVRVGRLISLREGGSESCKRYARAAGTIEDVAYHYGVVGDPHLKTTTRANVTTISN